MPDLAPIHPIVVHFTVTLAASLLHDLERLEEALERLRGLEIEPGSSVALRAGIIEAQAHQGRGDAGESRRVLEVLREPFPESGRLARAIEELGPP